MNVTLIGGDALVTNEFWQITGAAGEGTLMTFSSDPRKRPTAAEVVQRFRARTSIPRATSSTPTPRSRSGRRRRRRPTASTRAASPRR